MFGASILALAEVDGWLCTTDVLWFTAQLAMHNSIFSFVKNAFPRSTVPYLPYNAQVFLPRPTWQECVPIVDGKTRLCLRSVALGGAEWFLPHTSTDSFVCSVRCHPSIIIGSMPSLIGLDLQYRIPGFTFRITLIFAADPAANCPVHPSLNWIAAFKASWSLHTGGESWMPRIPSCLGSSLRTSLLTD